MEIIATESSTSDESLPLDLKILLSEGRIRDWYEYWGGLVYIALSGGKDSTVLADQVWAIYPDVPALFSNTGLEYPEIVDFVKRMQAEGRPIVITRPKRTFRDVVLTDGFPLVSKKVAMMISRLQKPRTDRNDATHNLYLTGIKRDGTFSRGSKLPDKWRKLLDAPFKTTQVCCDVLKKEPFRRYEKETGRKPFVGVMREEGGARAQIKTCNTFDGKSPQGRPMLFWKEADVWEYIGTKNLPYSDIYKDRVVNGVTVRGESRTGCMFCAFGAHMEKDTTRFQRMAISHPKQWNYCINKLGMGKALDFIGVPYNPEIQQDLFTDAATISNSKAR